MTTKLSTPPDAQANSELRRELADIAASLRAYLEWQQDTGAIGSPRRARSPSGGSPAASPPVRGRTEAIEAIGPTEASSTELASASSSTQSAPTGSAPPAATTSTPPERTSMAPPSLRAAASRASVAPPSTIAAAMLSRPPPPPSMAPRAHRPLSVIAEEASGCVKCGLSTTRKNVVFARGNPEAKLCFVGEAPGADEDAQGLPFVGRAGQLLDKMIQAMGLHPDNDVYICNIIKCRPPGNRRPEPIEVETCIPYLHEQLANVDPKVIVVLGNTAVAGLLRTTLGITKIRGQWKLYRGSIPVMPTYHPSYLLRPSPQQMEAKRQAWEDLQSVMKELGLPLKKA